MRLLLEVTQKEAQKRSSGEQSYRDDSGLPEGRASPDHEQVCVSLRRSPTAVSDRVSSCLSRGL